MELYEVGGCVRDEILGVPSKDIDFSVVLEKGEIPHLRMNGKLLGPTPFEVMSDKLETMGFEIFVTSPQYLTIRARFPRDMPRFAGREIFGLTADFVLARREGKYTDGRRPDEVVPGTLEDDLRRRDFTMNALAKDPTGKIIDLFGGLKDIEDRIIRTVGDPEDRFGEDGLRALRALRFAITKEMALDAAVSDALRSEWLPPLLAATSRERRREELLRAFRHNSMATLELVAFQTSAFKEALFADGLWLKPTLEG